MSAAWKKRFVSQSDLLTLGEQLKERGKKVVFTAGSWDLMHVGQVRYLEIAKSHGDILVVGVSSNDAIKRVKGPNKPILDENVRAEVVASLRAVDFVTLLPEPSCVPTLGLLRPDVYIIPEEEWASDYKNSKEYKTVTKYGGQVLVIQRQSTAISTSKIVQRAIGAHLGEVFKEFVELRKTPLKDR